MIESPRLVTTPLFGMSRFWVLYVNRYMLVSSLDNLGYPMLMVPFSLEPILLGLEGGKYMGPILPEAFAELISEERTTQRLPGGGSGGGNG